MQKDLKSWIVDSLVDLANLWWTIFMQRCIWFDVSICGLDTFHISVHGFSIEISLIDSCINVVKSMRSVSSGNVLDAGEVGDWDIFLFWIGNFDKQSLSSGEGEGSLRSDVSRMANGLLSPRDNLGEKYEIASLRGSLFIQYVLVGISGDE